MTTIDKFDIAIHIQYARRTQFFEQVSEEFRLKEADSIAPQLQVVDYYPRLSELDLLLGIVPRHAPWATFSAPDNFVKRSPFVFNQVAPKLGTVEKQQADLAKIEAVKCQTPEQNTEKVILTQAARMFEEINDSIGFVIGRVGQFLQG